MGGEWARTKFELPFKIIRFYTIVLGITMEQKHDVENVDPIFYVEKTIRLSSIGSAESRTTC